MHGKAQRDARPEVSQMETFAKFSGSKILGEKDPKLYAKPEIFIPHQTVKFGAIPPKDPDDRS